MHPAGLALELHLVPGAVLFTRQLDGHTGGDAADHVVLSARPGAEVLPDRGGRSLVLHLGQIVRVRPERLTPGVEAEPLTLATGHLDVRTGLQHGAYGVLGPGSGARVQPDVVHLIGAVNLRLGRTDLLQVGAVRPDGLTVAFELDPVAVLGGHCDLLTFGHALLHWVGGPRTAACVQRSGHPVDRRFQLLSTSAGGHRDGGSFHTGGPGDVQRDPVERVGPGGGHVGAWASRRRAGRGGRRSRRLGVHRQGQADGKSADDGRRKFLRHSRILTSRSVERPLRGAPGAPPHLSLWGKRRIVHKDGKPAHTTRRVRVQSNPGLSGHGKEKSAKLRAAVEDARAAAVRR